MESKLKNILFDLGGVLVRLDADIEGLIKELLDEKIIG